MEQSVARMTDRQAQPPESLATEANQWAIRLTDDPDDQTLRQEFSAWHARSPAHAEAWTSALRIWSLTGAIGPELLPTSARQSPPATRPDKTRHRIIRPITAIPVTAALCCAAWLLFPTLRIAMLADYTTATGQNRTVMLADGSSVTLGGKSAIAVSYTATRRNVTLLTGEAFFQIRHDTTRPFRVSAGELHARDIGTRFDIRMDRAEIRLGVQDGKVGMSLSGTDAPPELLMQAGDEVQVDRQTGKITQNTVAPDAVGSWRSGTLMVENETIGRVIDTLSRYYPGFIVRYDSALNTRHVGGLYDLNNIPAALQAVVLPAGDHVREIAGHVLLITPAQTPAGH